MGWVSKHLDRRVRRFFLPAIVGASLVLIVLSGLTVSRQAVLITILFLTAAIHWDLQDGGQISSRLYKRGTGFIARNYITVGLAFLLVTSILAAADAFSTPLIFLYYIPLALSAVRGGYRMTFVFATALLVSVFAYLRFFTFDKPEISTYFLVFLGLSLVSGFMAERMRRAALDLSALYETGRALNSTLNTAHIYPLILNIMTIDLTPDVSAIFMVDSQRHLCLQAYRGLVEDKVKDLIIKKGRGPIGKVSEAKESVLIPEMSRKTRLDFAPDVGSLMAAPMQVGDKLVGVLMVGKQTPGHYGHDNLRFLEALGSQAAICIQNANLYRQTKEWASVDALTGIYNFRYFTEQLDSEWSRSLRYEDPLSLIMIDVDLFKQINDNYGHLCGDEVLRELAQLIKQQTRETDIVARYGGEEFAIILPNTHYQDAYNVGEKLRELVAEAVFKGGQNEQKIKLTISLGVANYPSTANTKSDLIYQADQALYLAKTKRNTLASPLDAGRKLNLNPSEL